MASACIFCGSTRKKSKEHIWPDWMRECFPKSSNQEHTRETHTNRWDTNLGVKQLQRQGHLSTVRIRVVCVECNSGWMSQLEEKAKPLLKILMKNACFEMPAEKQRVLARWAVLKALVGEHAEKETCLTPRSDRNYFKNTGAIPEYFAVYIGSHNSESDSAWWLRISQTMALSHDEPSPPLCGMKRNTQSIAMICGSLFVFVLAIRVNEIVAENFLRLPKLAQIFPNKVPSIQWPPSSQLSTHDMGEIAYSFEEMKNLPSVHDGGELQ